MKKVFAISIALLMVLTMMVGCGKKEDPSTSPSETPVSSEPQTSNGSEPTGKLAEILDKGVITMATSPDFAPNEFIDDTKTGQESYVGADIELAKFIADYLGVELKIEAMDFAACQAAVQTGAVDISIAGYAATDERKENFNISDFFNKSDRPNQQGLLVKKGDAGNYTSAADFSGKKVAVQNGSLQANLVDGQLPDDIILEPISTLGDAVMMLMTGKVDAVAVASDNGDYFVDKNTDDIEMCDFYFDYTSEGSVILIKKGEDSLTAMLNEILAEVNGKDLYAGWKADAIELAGSLGIDL